MCCANNHIEKKEQNSIPHPGLSAAFIQYEKKAAPTSKTEIVLNFSQKVKTKKKKRAKLYFDVCLIKDSSRNRNKNVQKIYEFASCMFHIGECLKCALPQQSHSRECEQKRKVLIARTKRLIARVIAPVPSSVRFYLCFERIRENRNSLPKFKFLFAMKMLPMKANK